MIQNFFFLHFSPWKLRDERKGSQKYWGKRKLTVVDIPATKKDDLDINGLGFLWEKNGGSFSFL